MVIFETASCYYQGAGWAMAQPRFILQGMQEESHRHLPELF
jgi:hypothetical protein